MKKILSIFIILFIVISNFVIIVSSENDNNLYHEIKSKIYFKEPVLTKISEYVNVEVEGTNSYIAIPEHPIIPYYSYSYKFPIGTKIKNIEVTHSNGEIYYLENEIIQSHNPITINNGEKIYYENIIDMADNEEFPKENFNYQIGVGIEKTEHLILLSEYDPC